MASLQLTDSSSVSPQQHPLDQSVSKAALGTGGAVCSLLGTGTDPRAGQERDRAALWLLQEVPVASTTLSPSPHRHQRSSLVCLGNTYLPFCCFYEQHRRFVAFTARVKSAGMNKEAGVSASETQKHHVMQTAWARGEHEAVKDSGEWWWLFSAYCCASSQPEGARGRTAADS